MQSIYWVVSLDCNQTCPHCYNRSAPGAAGLSADEVSRCVQNLPAPGDVPLDRVVVSGGEPLAWPELLFHTFAELHARYGDAVRLMLQTNADLLDGPLLDRLLAAHVARIDVAGMDKYHPKATRERRGYLEDLFKSRGMTEVQAQARCGAGPVACHLAKYYTFWGATPDKSIGVLWPRGRAMDKGLSRATPEHRFCAEWSGAKGFLDYRGCGCDLSVQLADVYPCNVLTCRPLGSLLEEPLTAMLDRCAAHPVYRALNEGRPEAMGESLGISEEHGRRRSAELGNHCLWCDEFFTAHAPDLLYHGGRTERGTRDLLTLGLPGRS